MDVYCRKCGEPWDTDCFHNSSKKYLKIYTLFKEHGCPIAEQALDDIHPNDMSVKDCKRKPILEPDVLAAVDAIQDIMDDDVDGAASSLEDYFQ